MLMPTGRMVEHRKSELNAGHRQLRPLTPQCLPGRAVLPRPTLARAVRIVQLGRRADRARPGACPLWSPGLAGDGSYWSTGSSHKCRSPACVRCRLAQVPCATAAQRLAASWPGPPISPPRSVGFKPPPPADQPQPTLRPGKDTTRACGTPPTRRDSRARRHGHSLKTALSHSLEPPPKITKHRAY